MNTVFIIVFWALIEVFLLIIIITLDLTVIFFYRNKKK